MTTVVIGNPNELDFSKNIGKENGGYERSSFSRMFSKGFLFGVINSWDYKYFTVPKFNKSDEKVLFQGCLQLSNGEVLLFNQKYFVICNKTWDSLVNGQKPCNKHFLLFP